MRSVLPALLVVASWALCALGASANDRLETLGVRRWTVNDGLPNGIVRSLAQTPDGRLWIGTHDGLASFDGFGFETHRTSNAPAIPNDTISALATDADGALWVATHGGLARRQKKRRAAAQWRRIEEAGSDGTASMIAVGDSIWLAGGRRGIQQLRGGRLHRHAPAISRTNAFTGALIASAHDGTVWVAHPKLGLQRHRRGGIETIVAPGSVLAPGVTALAVDRQGGAWLGLKDGTLAHASANGVRIHSTPFTSPQDNIRTLFFDASGRLWIGTVRSGLARLANGTIERFPEEHPLSATNVLALFEDRERNLWVGTSRGLYRLRDVPVGRLQDHDVSFDYGAWSVYPDAEDDYWIATESGGLAHVRQATVRRYGARDGLGERVYNVARSANGRILATPALGGLRVLEGAKFAPLASASALSGESITELFEDSRGRLWLGGFVADDLYVLEDDTLKRIPYPAEIGRTSATDFAETDDGAIWAATYNAGLLRIEGGALRRFARREGLLDEHISSLHVDGEGALWIAAAGAGLNRLVDGRMDRYTAADGLPSHHILSMQHDPSGRLWLCTGRGLFALRLPPRDPIGTSAPRRISAILSYGEEDGMPNTNCSGVGRSIPRRSAKPLLAFSTSGGLIAIDPDRVDRKSRPPSTDIAALALDDAPTQPGETLRLGSETRRVRIEYTAISLREPHRLRFRHRLEGFDRDWSAPTQSREVSYTNLAPGRYRFAVQAKNGEGEWGATAELPISVSPPFYRSMPFYFLVLLIAASILILIHRLALAQLRARNAVLAERSRIAREIHDTLANGLLGIRLHLDVAKALVDTAPDEAKSYLDRARDLANESAEEARRSVYAMRQGSAAHPDAILAIVRQVEGLVLQAPPELRIRATQATLTMDAERQHELLRLVREAVINAINHAMAKSLEVDIDLQDDVLTVEIVDDGKGFERTADALSGARRYGLAGMRERAHRLGATLAILSRPGEGTRIRLRVPTRHRTPPR